MFRGAGRCRGGAVRRRSSPPGGGRASLARPSLETWVLWSLMFDQFGINAGYVEELHTRWLESPHGVAEEWRRFFEGAPPRGTNGRNGHAVSPGVTALPAAS